MEKKYLGVEELATILSISKNTIYSWISQRKIPYIKVGRLVRFDAKEIDRWLKENTNNAHPIY